MSNIFNKICTSITVVVFAFLTGCGGSSSISNSESTTSSTQQPHSLSSHEMTEVSILARDSNPMPILTYDDTTITITQVIDDGKSISHYQFFLNTDNDTSTGYQFDNVAWDQGGADYLIEDGDIYKSSANDDTWSWQSNIGNVISSTESNTFSITINKSLFQDLSSNITLGFIARNENWYVDSFYPQSSQMASYAIDLPSSTDTKAPQISLNGSEAMRLVKGSTFHDPGVYAYDEVDGDISSRAIADFTPSTLETLTTTVGTKEIRYSVTDSAGNVSSISRTVTVVVSPTKSIVIDGNVDDWANITEIASNSSGVIKVENNFAYLNILIKSTNLGDNTQIFIDTDNDSATGIQYIGDDWSVGGADYMIENRDLNKSTNPFGWSWDYKVAPISYIKKDGVIEVGILKSDLENLGETIKVGFVSRDQDWRINQELLPSTSMANYTLSLPTMIIPEEIEDQLCDTGNLQEEYPTGSFADGVIYNGKRYFSEEVTDGTETLISIRSRDLDGTNEEELISFVEFPEGYLVSVNPVVLTLNGALIFQVRPLENFVPRDSTRNKYRISDQNTIIDLGTTGITAGSGSYIGYVDNSLFYIYEPVDSVLTKRYLYGFNEADSQKELFYYENHGTYAIPPIYPLRTKYSGGKIYYAYTLGQLVESRVVSNIGQRVLGVIDDNFGLKPVSVCKAVN